MHCCTLSYQALESISEMGCLSSIVVALSTKQDLYHQPEVAAKTLFWSSIQKTTEVKSAALLLFIIIAVLIMILC